MKLKFYNLALIAWTLASILCVAYVACKSYARLRLMLHDPAPQMAMPSVDGKILCLGDSDLKIHPWHEYSDLPFAVRAVSGSTVEDVSLDMYGQPVAVWLSTGVNDLQKGVPIDEVERSLKDLICRIGEKWPNTEIWYMVPPAPNEQLYMRYIEPRNFGIHMPEQVELERLEAVAISAGARGLYPQTANIDGLHIDPDSAMDMLHQFEEEFKL